VENFGDAPFRARRVDAAIVAAMALVTSDVVEELNRGPSRFPVGVNVLRNDADAAMSIASICGAGFVRINVHTGAMVCDQGIIEGRAYDTLLLRRRLNSHVFILADVLVKHASPLTSAPIEALAEDMVVRGGAAGLIVSGSGTGHPTDPANVDRVRNALPHTPVFIGSGLTMETLEDALIRAQGAIVGTALKGGDAFGRSISSERARAFVEARERWFARKRT